MLQLAMTGDDSALIPPPEALPPLLVLFGSPSFVAPRKPAPPTAVLPEIFRPETVPPVGVGDAARYVPPACAAVPGPPLGASPAPAVTALPEIVVAETVAAAFE